MQWESTMYTYGRVRQPPELCHYGIKGQKWGLRRFQLENGSYTPEGKERYGRVTSNNVQDRLKKSHRSNGNDPARGMAPKSKGSNKKGHPDWKPEDAEKLSDDELNRRNSRMQREQQYRDSTTPKWKKEAKQTAKDWTKEALKKIFIASAVVIAADVVRKQYKKADENIRSSANRKIAALKAANMLKKEVEKNRYFDNRGPEILGKHVGRR